MSTAAVLAKADRAAAQIQAKGSLILLRHDGRTVNPATGALSGASSPTDYQVRGLVQALTVRSGGAVQAGDVLITVGARDLPSRPVPGAWFVFVGGSDPEARPVPGAAGVEQLAIVDSSDAIQQLGVSFLYSLHCRR